jgi:hypothetical protein
MKGRQAIRKLLSTSVTDARRRRDMLLKSECVFFNRHGRPMLPDSMNQNIWKTTLKKAGLKEDRKREPGIDDG